MLCRWRPGGTRAGEQQEPQPYCRGTDLYDSFLLLETSAFKVVPTYEVFATKRIIEESYFFTFS